MNRRKRINRAQVEAQLLNQIPVSPKVPTVNDYVFSFDPSAGAGYNWSRIKVQDLLNLVSTGATVDEFVKISNNDTTAGFLQSKIQVDDTLHSAIVNPAGNEKLLLRSLNVGTIVKEATYGLGVNYSSGLNDLPGYVDTYGQNYVVKGCMQFTTTGGHNAILGLNIGLNSITRTANTASGYFVFEINYAFNAGDNGSGIAFYTIETYDATGTLVSKITERLSGSDIKQLEITASSAVNLVGNLGVIGFTINKYAKIS